MASDTGASTSFRHFASRGFGSSQLTRLDVSVLVAALICLLGVRVLMLIWLPMTDTTEARYAEIARKMLETGNWVTPQYDYGIPFWGKPPLHTWASALGMKTMGVGHIGARVPILLFSVGVLWTVFTFARRRLGREQAFLCVTVLASSVLFYGASAFVMTDMAMTLGTTLCMCGFYVVATSIKKHTIWQLCFFAGLAIGVLAKGPVAIVLTGIPIFLWLLVGGRWSRLRRFQWGKGLLLTAALSVPWYVSAELATPGFLRYFFIGEHFERFVISNWQGDLYGSGHAQPKGIIWLYACAAFLPWIFFAFVLLGNLRGIAVEIIDDLDGWLSYLLLWAVSPMLLFTPAANILAAYVLPGLPAASILLVSVWMGVHRKPNRRIRLAFGAALGGSIVLYLWLALMLVYAPGDLNLRTYKGLIERAYAVNPDIQITYLDKRRYSAEFYSGAQINYISDPSDIERLHNNARHDAVAVPENVLPELDRAVIDRFQNVGLFRDKYLFVEKPDAELRP